MFGMLGEKDRLVTCQYFVGNSNLHECLHANSIKHAVPNGDKTSVMHDI